MDDTLTVTRLGARGDGVARHDGRDVFVPLTLPGETVRARLPARPAGGRGPLRARVIERLGASPDRADPVCPHFGSCGGCAAQHLVPDAYVAWKSARLADALAGRGLDAHAAGAPIMVPPGTRRRARLAVRHARGAPAIGFRETRGAAIVPIESCPLLVPALARLLDPLRALLARLRGRGPEIEIVLTASDTGVDVTLLGLPTPGMADRERLAEFAERNDLARIALGAAGASETVVTRRAPRMMHGGIAVDLPPAGFVQPTAEGEAAIVRATLSGLGPAARIADLYAGIGCLGLAAWQRGAHVTAIEGDAAAAAALAGAASACGTRFDAIRRDLARRPLADGELARFDAVVLDPPRAGAAAQAAALARSAVPLVISVSCNPASFARDARTLVDGGYRLEAITALDQFRWSHHLEAIGVLRR